MNCQVCYNQFDHSRHKPYSLSSCPHTFCIDCLNKIKTKKCPYCSVPFTSKNPNLSLLELIPESQYDKTRSELDKLVNEAKELKTKLHSESKKKLNEHLSKIQELRLQIKKTTSKLIKQILSHKLKLLDEVHFYESSIKNGLNKLKYDAEVDMKLNLIKHDLETNDLDEDQIISEKSEIHQIKSKLNQMITRVAQFNEQLEFITNRLIDSETCAFGEVKGQEKTAEEYHQIADDLYVQEKNEEAVFFYDKAIKSNPNSKELCSIYVNKAAALTEMDLYDQVLECYNQVISLDPNYPMAYYHKGETLVAMDNLQEALNAYNKALELDPENELFREAKLLAAEIQKRAFETGSQSHEPKVKKFKRSFFRF